MESIKYTSLTCHGTRPLTVLLMHFPIVWNNIVGWGDHRPHLRRGGCYSDLCVRSGGEERTMIQRAIGED